MEKTEIRNINNKLNEILRRKHLSVTDSRKKILSLFLASNDALAHGDIEKKAGEKFDRVTVYRTLQTFVEKGIVHTIPTSENSVRYALCKDCTEGHHHDNHVHFVCANCQKTICLDNIVSPEIKLPQGYLPHNVQVVINGICDACNEPT
jgi:Fur family transcriptional regulator, ferric uptake regulator